MITVTSVKEYLEINDKRRSVLCVLRKQKFRYFVGGGWIGQDIFDSMFPAAEYRAYNRKGDNACKKSNFVNNVKSY